MYYFTADEHYGHRNILKYANRPFDNVDEMDNALINNFNATVNKDDITIHAGDFCWCKTYKEAQEKYISKLNGRHIFLRGSHDRWLDRKAHEIWEKRINGQYIVVCHYALRVWPRSHYNSWCLYAHSHGKLPPIGKSSDIGVDNNNYFPFSSDDIEKIMETRLDNINFIGQIQG